MTMNTAKSRNRLCLSASVLVFAACFGAASAADVVLDSGTSPWVINGDHTTDNVIVQSGTTAFVTGAAADVPVGDLGIIWNGPPSWAGSPSTSSTGSCNFGGCWTNADTVTVQSGGTILIDNPWGWQPFQSIFNVAGDAQILHAGWGGGQTILMGTNTFTGNLTLVAGAPGNTNTLQVGQDWAPAAIVFGSATNIDLQDRTLLELWMGSATATVGGRVYGTGALTIHSGTVVINGANTAGAAFTGTVTVDGGASLVIGDVSHATAVFGDPTASAAVINVGQGGGRLGSLKGYGTIYASVNNNGLVVPGGTAGTLTTMTIGGNYTQTATGVLQVEVSPTGASALHVVGSAALNGSMQIRLDAGDYGNSVFPIFSAGSISGSFSSVSTSGSVSGAIVALQQTSSGFNIVTEKASSSQVFGHMVTANRYGLYDFTSSLYDVMAVGTPATGSRNVTVWLTPTGRLDNIGRNGAGYGLTAFGVSGGVQYNAAWHNAIIGAAISYGHASMDVKHETTEADSDTVNLAVYGGADVQYARLDGIVFYNTYDAETNRTLGSFGTASGKPTGWGWGGSMQVSRSLFSDRVVPFVRGTFARVAQDGLSETGVDTFDLQYDAITANTFVGDLGLKVNVLPATAKVRLQVLAAVRHDFSDPGERIKGSFASLSGSSFDYKWAGDSANSILVGANAGGEIMDKLMVFGRVGGEFSQFRRSINVGVGAKYRF